MRRRQRPTLLGLLTLLVLITGTLAIFSLQGGQQAHSQAKVRGFSPFS